MYYEISNYKHHPCFVRYQPRTGCNPTFDSPNSHSNLGPLLCVQHAFYDITRAWVAKPCVAIKRLEFGYHISVTIFRLPYFGYHISVTIFWLPYGLLCIHVVVIQAIFPDGNSERRLLLSGLARACHDVVQTFSEIVACIRFGFLKLGHMGHGQNSFKGDYIRLIWDPCLRDTLLGFTYGVLTMVRMHTFIYIYVRERERASPLGSFSRFVLPP